MEILRVSEDGAARHSGDELPSLRDDGALLWVDVPEWEEDTAAVLTETVRDPS